jgi:hypothetical protein
VNQWTAKALAGMTNFYLALTASGVVLLIASLVFAGLTLA